MTQDAAKRGVTNLSDPATIKVEFRKAAIDLEAELHAYANMSALNRRTANFTQLKKAIAYLEKVRDAYWTHVT